MRLTRRSFIKGSLVAGAAAGLAGTWRSGQKWFREARATGSQPEERIAYTYHPPNCGGRCSMKCTVRDGRLVKIEPNEWPDKRFSLICLRGLSEVERVYSPDRIQQPMKRVGERGEGKFEPVSWEQALDDIAAKLKELKERYGGKAILFKSSSGVEYAYDDSLSASSRFVALLGAQGQGWEGIDIGAADGHNLVTGELAFGATQNEITDWVNSNLIILFGSNILETTMTDAQFFFDAQEAGAKIVSVDPVYSTTAAKADQWIPLRPGTDAALLWGMINLVLENDWYQDDYLKKYSTAPFLVRQDNGKLLRESDLAPAGSPDKYLVWDTVNNAARPHDAAGVSPALEGSFTTDGIQVKTVFTLLKETARQYTPAWAAETTKIPEQVIRDLTREYALGGPAVLGFGYAGTDKWYHADTFGRLAAILGVLTGNIGRVGGGVGGISHHITAWNALLAPWPLPPQFQPAPREIPFAEMPFKPNSVRAFIIQGNILQQHLASLDHTIEWIKKLELVVVIDPFFNPSSLWADYLLPACTCFESEYEVNNLQINRSHVLLQGKVIAPLFQAKTDFQIQKELAERLGLSQYLPKTPEELQRVRLASGDPALEGITVEALKANNYVMRLKVPEEPYRGYRDHKFPTPTGKLELYHEVLLPEGMALPKYEEPYEASPQNPLYKKYPLVYIQTKHRFRAHSQFSNARWLLEINPEPVLEINPADAEARGLKDGDLVEVFNDRGQVRVRCQFTPEMRPGMVKISEGWWLRYFAAGSFQSLTNPTLNPRQLKEIHGPVVPFYDSLVEVRKV
ncbi:MAG: twin-arginine translocation signal domain-containing protein [Clostridia bacterium]|nr:MAG: twin-arginine translocation signal domain-containing protein [Clostridia bacterium]